MYVCRETLLMFSGGVGGGGCNTILDVYYLYEKKTKTKHDQEETSEAVIQ